MEDKVMVKLKVGDVVDIEYGNHYYPYRVKITEIYKTGENGETVFVKYRFWNNIVDMVIKVTDFNDVMTFVAKMVLAKRYKTRKHREQLGYIEVDEAEAKRYYGIK